MEQFSAHGEQVIQNIAYRYGLSQDAVKTMLFAVMRGNGTMAQFSHPELGGMGQWMQGGMTMVGDMFNNGLKMTVDNLCNELSRLLQQRDSLFQPAPQAPANWQNNNFASGFGNNMNSGQWWPADLGYPSSSGAQNDSAYAFFPQQQRLAIKLNGVVTIYNSLDHQIGGVSQQQGTWDSMTFTSQYGVVRVADLPVINVIR
ncbi:MAG: hypothetical protein RI964_738 [Pseudomonadota bacterium]